MRRLAAILAIDVVGFSGLMARDEPATLDALMRLRGEVLLPMVERHGGRVFKEMGDGFLVELPSALAAVACGRDLLAGLARPGAAEGAGIPLRARVGIALGDVVGVGEDVFGQGVNLAWRLQGEAEPGTVVVSQEVAANLQGLPDVPLAALGQRRLKNLPEPVALWRVGDAGAGGAAVDTVLGRPALAVLPFQNMGADAADDFLVDGLTEDLVTALSSWRWFPVIGRNSTEAHRREGRSGIQTARAVGARYVLEGGIRRAGAKVRLTCQLTDAESGHQLWARRLDRTMEDVLGLQDELAHEIVAAIEPELARAEQARALRRGPESLDVWELCHRGRWHLRQGGSRNYEIASSLLTKATEIAPESAFAWAYLAYCRFHQALFSWTKDPPRVLASTFEAAQRAVALDQGDWLGQSLHAISTLWVRRDFDAAIAGARRAIALNPSASLAHYFFGCISIFAGEPADSLRHMEAVFKIDPAYPGATTARADMGLALMMMSRFEEAREQLEQAIALDQRNVRAWQRLAVHHGLTGDLKAGAEAAARLKSLQRDFDRAYVEATYPFRYKGHAAAFRQALVKVGALPA